MGTVMGGVTGEHQGHAERRYGKENGTARGTGPTSLILSVQRSPVPLPTADLWDSGWGPQACFPSPGKEAFSP